MDKRRNEINKTEKPKRESPACPVKGFCSRNQSRFLVSAARLTSSGRGRVGVGAEMKAFPQKRKKKKNGKMTAVTRPTVASILVILKFQTKFFFRF